MSTRQTRSATAHLRPAEPPETQANTPTQNERRRNVRVARPMAATMTAQTPNKLSSLPPEIEDLILSFVQDPSSVGRLGRTCKRYYELMTPQLHKRVAVSAMFHAHIPKLIRALQPYLTTAQKRQMKTEGKYKGQQETYSKLLRRDEIPECATYVRQLIFGVADPGRSHLNIVLRYLEESLQNLDNLEVVELYVLTHEIVLRLASLKRLRALHLVGGRLTREVSSEEMEPLKKIKNLQVLGIEGPSDVVQSMLINSISTLKSLSLAGWAHELSDLAQGWDQKVSATGAPSRFSSLEDLSIAGYADSDFIGWLRRTIDTAQLQELEIGCIGDDNYPLIQYLQEGLGHSSNPNLQVLILDAQHAQAGSTASPASQAWYTAMCNLLHSFTSLKRLELKNFGHYEPSDDSASTVPESLCQSIFKHRGLRCLKINHYSRGSGVTFPTLPASLVETILESLPDLEEFEFEPKESEIEKIGELLARAAHLRRIECFFLGSSSEGDETNPFRSLLTGMLSRASSDDIAGGHFIWEHHSKLRQVTFYNDTWEVASSFGKSKKGMKKPQKLQINGCEVLFRNISGTFPHPIHVGYDPNFAWVERASQKISR